MVQITEFRVVMPLSLPEYKVAQRYMVTKMQRENTSGGEGVEVMVNEPFKDDQLGEGLYTRKLYRLESKFPAWISAIAPANSLQMEEEAWNAYPRCKTVIKCTYFTRFKLTIDTIHIADNGTSPNVHNLDEELLALRKVERLDIASTASDYWSYMIAGGSSIDLSSFRSAKTDRGPLLSDWQETCSPVMTAYKLVTIDAPYWGWGLGNRMEQALLGAEKALFLESHKRCFLWIDEWLDLTEEDIRRMEAENESILRKILHNSSEISETLGGE